MLPFQEVRGRGLLLFHNFNLPCKLLCALVGLTETNKNSCSAAIKTAFTLLVDDTKCHRFSATQRFLLLPVLPAANGVCIPRPRK